MIEFFRELFTWKWRWNRLKFWLYPLVMIIPMFVLLSIIWFMSFSSYTDQAKESVVFSDLNRIRTAVQLESAMYNINSFKNEDNSINFISLRVNPDDYKNPFSEKFWEYKIFVKNNMYQIYWETPNQIIIKWDYSPENENEPKSLVVIDWVRKINGLKELSKWNWNDSNTILPIIIFLFYILMFYISITSYMKRLRDLDKSPWMSLLSLVPFANIYLLILCGFFKWTVWPNKYGTDPLNPNMEKVDNIEL